MKYFLSIILILVNTVGHSQTLDLNPVLVESTIQQKRIRETGRNIIRLSKEELQKIPGNSLDEILRFIPGIEVQMRGPAGAQADFVMRGGTFQQVLVLIDGIRMNEPLTGHFNNYIPVLKEEIQSIEIIKGAAASIFGPDAVGGVIHIITQKSFEEKKQQHVRADIKRGSYGLFQNTFSGEVSNQHTSLFLGAQINKTDGQALRGTNGFVNTELFNMNFSKKFANDWKVYIRGAVDRRDFNAQNFYTTFLSDTAREKVNSTWQQFSLSKTTPKTDYYFLLGARQLNDNYQFRPGAIPNDNRSQLLNADLRQIQKLKWQQAKWTSGVQLFNKVIRSNDRGNHTHKHMGAYSSLMHQPLKGLFLTEGIRLDWDQSYQWNFIPQINIAYIINNIAFRASAGKGVRDADFTERYNNYNKTLVTSGRIGNPNLKAEKSINLELGADFFTNKPIQLHASLFRRNQTNMIDWVQTKFELMPRQSNLITTGAYALAMNIANVNTSGAELDINGMHKITDQLNLRWNSGLTSLKSVAADNISSIYLSNYANLVWNSNFQLTTSNWMLSISTLYKQRPEQKTSNLTTGVSKSFGLMNIRADKYLFNQSGAIYLQIENLFNVQYADFLGAKMPGRWIMTGFRLHLSKNKPV
ncbi:MAG: TonB-dependent receptor plug domain-containing protein [Chitinophagaceae bacterium]